MVVQGGGFDIRDTGLASYCRSYSQNNQRKITLISQKKKEKESFISELMVSCVHSDTCRILFGDDLTLEKIEDDAKNIIEIVANVPTYTVVVHPEPKLNKKPGVVVLTTKTLSPKCLTCSSRGKNMCLHIKIHTGKFKKTLNESDSSSDVTELEGHDGV